MIISAGKSDQAAGVRVERGQGFPHWTAGFFLSGLTEVACDHRTFLLAARSCLIIPPTTPYRLTVQKREREIWMIFDPRPHLVPALRSTEDSAGVTCVAFRDPAIWDAVFLGLQDLARWWGAHPPQLALAENALEKALLLTQWTRGLEKRGLLDERIARVTTHIEEHFHEGLSVETMARVAALSPSRLAHLFRDHMGLTPMQFLEMRRIERAKQLLLTTDLQVQQVAEQTGFPNAQHFSIRFRKLTGQSPKGFREKPRRRFAELNPQEE